MKAVILAAGSNLRLEGTVGSTPKALFPLDATGETLLSLLIQGLSRWELSQILVVTGEFYAQFSQSCAELVDIPVEVITANLDYVQGPLFTYLSAQPYIEHDAAVVLPADIYIAPEGFQVLAQVVREGEVGLFTQDLFPDHRGHVIAAGEILPRNRLALGRPAQVIFPVIQLTPEFSAFAREASQEGATRLIDVIIEWKEQDRVISYHHLPPFFWVDVDTPEDLERAQLHLDLGL